MEEWDVYDAQGDRTGEVVPKGLWREGDRHLAVELWLANGVGDFLFQERSSQCEAYPGIWAVTAGRAIAGEDSPTACLREAQEELGLTLYREELQFIRRIIRTDYIWDIYLVQRTHWPQTMTLQAEEVAQVAWLSCEELRHQMEVGGVFVYPEMEEVLQQVERCLLPIQQENVEQGE